MNETLFTAAKLVGAAVGGKRLIVRFASKEAWEVSGPPRWRLARDEDVMVRDSLHSLAKVGAISEIPCAL